jgi:hypothetical protein
MMKSNPYESPAPPLDSMANDESPSRSAMPITGLFFGGACGFVGGLIGGALGGATYRLMHPSVIGTGGWFGLFEKIATPLDFALFFGVSAAIGLALFGVFLGTVQGARAARWSFGNDGIIAFSIAGLIIGLMIGILATGVMPARMASHFLEGPLASAVFGALSAGASWAFFSRRMNSLSQLSGERQTSFLCSVVLTILGAMLLTSGTIPALELGTPDLQMAMRFATILILGIASPILWFQWKQIVSR